jgi:hypothetical protein
MEIYCDNCKWWVDYGEGTEIEDEVGACQRHAPRGTVMPKGEAWRNATRYEWPITGSYDRCGDAEPK